MLNQRPAGGKQAQPAAGAHGARFPQPGSSRAALATVGPANPSDPISVSRLARISSSWQSNVPMVAKWVDIW